MFKVGVESNWSDGQSWIAGVFLLNWCVCARFLFSSVTDLINQVKLNQQSRMINNNKRVGRRPLDTLNFSMYGFCFMLISAPKKFSRHFFLNLGDFPGVSLVFLLLPVILIRTSCKFYPQSSGKQGAAESKPR